MPFEPGTRLGPYEIVAPLGAARSFGTVQYMAPEQLEGLSGDHRADIFALGWVLYEMLSRRIPSAAGRASATSPRSCGGLRVIRQ